MNKLCFEFDMYDLFYSNLCIFLLNLVFIRKFYQYDKKQAKALLSVGCLFSVGFFSVSLYARWFEGTIK